MTNQALIDMLAANATPASPSQHIRDVSRAIAAGAGLTFCAVARSFGIQPGLDTFAHGAPFVMKAAYAMTLAGIALSVALVLARPGALVRGMWRWLGVPVAGLSVLAFFELARLPMEAWPDALMGSSWQQCPWRVVALSIPVFAGLCIAFRRQAPTDLTAAGAAAGLLAGGVAATFYALACTESSAAFVLVWYSAGIGISTGLGALLGPKLLRW